MEDKKLNYKQAADMLGVPTGTLYAWVCRKQIPHLRLSARLVRFSQSELNAWLAGHHVAPQLNKERSSK